MPRSTSHRVAAAALLALGLAAPAAACRSRAGGGPSAADAGAPIQALVLPSPGDAHLALLPAPVQFAVQARPAALLADPMLSLAVNAFLGALSDDADATGACLAGLERNAEVVTYAWIGGDADGMVALADGPVDSATLAACIAALGLPVPAGGIADPPVGAATPLGTAALARLGPQRRAIGLLPTIEAVRTVAARPAADLVPRGTPDDLLPRLRQGDVKLYADLDQLAALGATDLPLQDDADHVAVLLRLQTMRADTVLLAHARSGPAITRLDDTLQAAISGLRRAILDEPGVPEDSVLRVFDDARVERIGDILRIELLMDRPTLDSLVGFLAHRLMPRRRESGGPGPVAPAAPADAGAAPADVPEAAPADAGPVPDAAPGDAR